MHYPTLRSFYLKILYLIRHSRRCVTRRPVPLYSVRPMCINTKMHDLIEQFKLMRRHLLFVERSFYQMELYPILNKQKINQTSLPVIFIKRI